MSLLTFKAWHIKHIQKINLKPSSISLLKSSEIIFVKKKSLFKISGSTRNHVKSWKSITWKKSERIVCYISLPIQFQKEERKSKPQIGLFVVISTCVCSCCCGVICRTVFSNIKASYFIFMLNSTTWSFTTRKKRNSISWSKLKQPNNYQKINQNPKFPFSLHVPTSPLRTTHYC